MRVIAGAFGGRRLQAPKGLGTRPTSDRVREALFMALEPLAGARVVDLYAGSGALGIEALSRGATHVDFVEHDARAREALMSNLESLGTRERATVWPLDLPRGLSRISASLEAADLVLADPPYGGDEATRLLDSLGARSGWKPGARVILEHHHRDEIPAAAGTLSLVRQRRYGETTVSTYEAAAPGADVPERGAT
jgi:16S rRNA (guanine(966)-N(2))-methyltransferase RsmD